MRNFFWKSFGASALATLIVGIALIFIFIALFTSMVAGIFDNFSELQGKKLEINDKSILHMKLSGSIEDRNSVLLTEDRNILSGSYGLHDMTEALRYAQEDERIEGILLEVDVIMGGLANLKDLRDELSAFRKSGKFIIAFSNTYSQAAYYLASAADELYIYPYGYLQLNGLVARVSFIKGMLEKLQIDMQIIRGSNNKFKSAVEPLIATQMSEANKEQNLRFISTMWKVMSSEMAAARNMTPEAFNSIVDSLPLMVGNEAEQMGIVDKVIDKDQLDLILLEKTGSSEKDNLVSFSRYCKMVREEKDRFFFDGNIAVVYAQGSIGVGAGDRESIGTRNIPDALQAAADDPMIKAIVLRINSGGGAVLTSDIILKKLVQVRKKKPVVVSMGNVAASGGYLIALPADKIIASPLTITGSIGVFGVWPNMQGFFEDKIGITFDHVSTNEQGDFGSVVRPLNEQETARIQKEIDQVYDDFISNVDTYRTPIKSKEEVDSIGQGRVWSGTDALEIGLIDELGSLYQAIDYAAGLGGVKAIVVKEYPRYKLRGLEMIAALLDNIENEGGSLSISAGIKGFESITSELVRIKDLAGMKGVQARMMWLYSFE